MIEFKGICKSFMATSALADINFKANRGEILALLGQNGAGKSTLMKILSGVYQKDAGSILIDNQEAEIQSPGDAKECGIGIVYQELSGVPHLSVAENIVLGREPKGSLFLDVKTQNDIARAALARMGVHDINLKKKLRNLSVSQQQICEIAKCISTNPKIVIFDEPTAALTAKEREKLFDIMRKMRDDNLTIIFITHFLEEAIDLADKCLILKDGKTAFYGEMKGMTQEDLVGHMIGGKMDKFYPDYVRTVREQPALEIRCFGEPDRPKNDLLVHYGEVVGIAGLIGSGQSELAQMIFGARGPVEGDLFLGGKKTVIANETEALDAGIAYISEDRRVGGLNLTMPISFNVALPSLVARKSTVAGSLFTRDRGIARVTRTMIDTLAIACRSPRQRVVNLSGGNQQKVSIGKWIATDAKFFIFDEPTKGIDVAAKAKVCEVIRTLAAEGCGVLVISSYNPELIGICDRIEVMSRGRFVRSFGRGVTEDEIMLAQQG